MVQYTKKIKIELSKEQLMSEVKKVIDRARKAQTKLQAILKEQDWIEDARKYAEKQGKEVKKLLNTDTAKIKNFLEKERKELERFQKEIPGEVKKLRNFVKTQRKELEKLLKNLRKATKTGNFRNLTKTKKSPSKRATKKSTASTESGTSA